MLKYRQFDFSTCRAFFTPKGENSTSSSIPSLTTTPLSPTNYKQPPTPDHPPPSAQTAERMILERIRPLSQVGVEYFENSFKIPVSLACDSDLSNILINNNVPINYDNEGNDVDMIDA